MTTILLDGDIVAYQFASAAEKSVNWGDGLWTLHAFEDEVTAPMDDFLVKLQDKLDASRLIIALTDGVNWRLDVLPTYKSNRSDKRKPMLLPFARQYLLDKYETFLRPTLEGDDVLGILMTHPKLVPGPKVLASIDKDMQTIPGSHYHMRDDRTFDVSPAYATYRHFLQTLTGDTTDGYSGCPGIGPKRAEAILEGFCDHTAGTFDAEGAWAQIVKVFEKAKLGESEALTQARVARICHASDYDFKNKEVKLWQPPS